MWLAAENGMFLRLTRGEWMTTMPEHVNMEWVNSVEVLLSLEFSYIPFTCIVFPSYLQC